jgi:uncharacterized SAM-binding protein YcdF (DUF218 family)
LKTALTIAIACFVVLIFLFLWQGEAFLTIDNADDCNNVDAVIVLAGGPEDDSLRVKRGVEIAHSRGTEYLILPLRNSAITWSWLVDQYGIETPMNDKHVLIKNMQPDDRHIFKRYGGTFLEAKKTITIMLEHHLHSAVVVSSGYHMRRARLAFKKVGKGLSVTFFYHPVPRSSANRSPWWTDIMCLLKVMFEYGKLVAAHAGVY